MARDDTPVLALSGGVGGAKLSLGLADALAPGALQVLANTADDFEHLGLRICPDIDTLLYTLSGRASARRGWGLARETWHTLAALEQLGASTWFQLGDRDLATHLWRSGELAAGRGLAAVTAELARRLDVAAAVHPMSEDPVRTLVHSDRGELPFQQYFVRYRCEPTVRGFSFDGIDTARPNAAVLSLLERAAIERIVICPSNPFVSIDPILQLPGLWQALKRAAAPVLLVSPIVGGRAIKGPAAKMMGELGLPVTALGVARHYVQRYPGLVDCFVIDTTDATLVPSIRALGVEVVVTDTVMHDRQDKRRLAGRVLQLGGA